MKKSSRIVSVDIFRGMTVAFMILVNNPGSWGAIFTPFEHARWHGCTPTDLVFPFFLFIVGTSIVLAYHKKKANNTSGIYPKIVKRGFKLVLLGLFLAGFTWKFPFFKSFAVLRLPGVLQRIGVVFVIAAILYINLDKKKLWWTFAGILLAYWALMSFVPVQGHTGDFTKEFNPASYLDLQILSRAHMWKKLYDPEGILSTLPSVATAIMGMYLGFILIDTKRSNKEKLFPILYTGITSLTLGYLWSFSFPLNKALWTSSYVLYTGGWAFIVFALIYYVTEIAGWKAWGKGFIYFGSNAISVFFLSGFIAKSFYIIRFANGERIHTYLYKTFYTSWIHSPKVSSLIYALSVIFCYYLIVRFMYKKGIIIKV